MWVVSQKTLTGHAKGGSAAWQLIGLSQTLASGTIPGNRNLDNVDPKMKPFEHMAFTNKPLRLGTGRIKAGLVTSLGFGHVSGLILLCHSDVFLELLEPSIRETYQAQVASRHEETSKRLRAIYLGQEKAYDKRSHRRFQAEDGTASQTQEEVTLLTNPKIRFDPHLGQFH